MKNKLLVITGGSKGIGRSIILKFAKMNFDIITCSRNLDDLSKLKEDVNKESKSVSVNFIQSDLSKEKECQNFIDYVKSFKRNLDLLVNNVGIFSPGKIYNEDEGILKRMINTNLYSNYHISRGLIPSMLSRKKGHIFNICSIASKIAYSNGGSYCVSKFALYGMSLCLREELKDKGIKVTSVLPGATLTSSWDGSEFDKNRFVQPNDIAESIFSIYNMSSGSTVEEIIIRPQLGDI
tara:strand:- start:8993 stop:9703 length:711 start_codon:yes stop_codon:yes gene_type:complete